MLILKTLNDPFISSSMILLTNRGFPVSFRYQFDNSKYQFGRMDYQFGNIHVLELINSISFRRGKFSFRYQFGKMIIFQISEFIFPVLLSIFPAEYSDISGLIIIFSGNQNDFSGMILYFSGLIL